MGFSIYDEANTLIGSSAISVRAESGSETIEDVSAAHRIEFHTDNDDHFFADIVVTQDGIDVSSEFTCADCAPGTQSTEFTSIYLDTVADTSENAAACDTLCNFIRDGNAISTFSWTIDGTYESGADGEIGLSR